MARPFRCKAAVLGDRLPLIEDPLAGICLWQSAHPVSMQAQRVRGEMRVLPTRRVCAQSGRNFATPSFSPLPGIAIIVDVPCAISSPVASITRASA